MTSFMVSYPVVFHKYSLHCFRWAENKNSLFCVTPISGISSNLKILRGKKTSLKMSVNLCGLREEQLQWIVTATKTQTF